MTPKTHDGSVEALRALQIVHRSAMKSRTTALNQLHALVVTAPEAIRAQLRGLPRRQLLAIRILEHTAWTTAISKRRR